MGNLPQLVKASSDPSIATNQENLERDVELNNLGEALMPPPYTVRFISCIFFHCFLLQMLEIHFFGVWFFKKNPCKMHETNSFIHPIESIRSTISNRK